MEFNNVAVATKLGISATLAAIAVSLNIYIFLFIVLFLALSIDYVTGIIDAGMQGKLDPDKGFRGIIKKLCYGIAVALGFCIDYLVYYLGHTIGLTLRIPAFFGLLVTVWLIINEGSSIGKHLAHIGVPVPKFLLSAFNLLGKITEKAGEVPKDE